MRAAAVEPAAEQPAAPGRSLVEGLLSALPLATLFAWLALYYAWQAWLHGTPWLFTDELKFAELSRSIAETGRGAVRGKPQGFDTLYAYAIAPVWRIHDTETAYALGRYLGVLLMTSALFPAYGLARMLVSRRAALFAAAATAAIPALVYSSFLMEEPLAYPYSTLCLYLIAKALATRRRWWIAGAVVASLVAPLVRGELGVIPAVFALAALLLAWGSEPARRWRARWSAWDWAGAVLLVIGAAVLASAVMGHLSTSWYVATGFFKQRMLKYGLWATGALAIGLGLLPVVAGLASIARPRDEPRTPERRAFACVLAAGVLGFGLYTAVKAAYLSTVFATLIEERNLIYVSPLLFVATALWVDRPRVRLLPLAAAAGLVAYLIATTPYQMSFRITSDAPGLTILSSAKRYLGLTPGLAELLLFLLLAVSVGLLLADRLPRRSSLVRIAPAVAAGFVLAWNVTAELSAAVASNQFSNEFEGKIGSPFDWVDRATGREPAIYLGQGIDDANPIWQLEFWNRSVREIWSLDSTAPGPGDVVTPDLAGPDGALVPNLKASYVVADGGVNLVGKIVARRKTWRLYRIELPLRLANAVTGIYKDGWAGSDSAYSQFSTPSGRSGFAVVTISRSGWRGADRPGHVRITVGRIAAKYDEPIAIGAVTAVRRWVVHSGGAKVFSIPAPPPPFRVEVHVSPTFSPHDFGYPDSRQLGAQVAFGFTERKPGAS